jgi:hypothetical protein
MSSRMKCPSGHVLAITPAMEGKRIKCPKCLAIMEVPILTAVENSAPPKPPPLPADAIQESSPPRERWRRDEEDDERPRRSRRGRDDDDDRDDEPRSRRARDDDDYDEERDGKAKKKLRRRQMLAVRTGLLLFYWKFILYLAAIFAYMFVSVLLKLAGESSGLVMVALIISGFATLAIFAAAPILGIVGGSFIGRVPQQTNARGLAGATLILEAVPAGCGILAMVNGAISLRRPGFDLIGLVFILFSALASLAAFILFMLFLRQLAYHLKDRGTAKEAMSLMIAYLITFVGGWFVIVIAGYLLARLRIGSVGGIILFVMMIGWIALLIKQLFAILGVIATVRARI